MFNLSHHPDETAAILLSRAAAAEVMKKERGAWERERILQLLSHGTATFVGG